MEESKVEQIFKKSIKFSQRLSAKYPEKKKNVRRKTDVPELPKIFRYSEENETEQIRLPRYEHEDFGKIARARISRMSSMVRWRDSTSLGFNPDFQSTIIKLFHEVDSSNRRRRTKVFRPIERYLPTYRLTSHKPFNAVKVKDVIMQMMLNKVSVCETLQPRGYEEFSRTFSESLLFQIKSRKYDRYRIVVSVTIGEKFFQGFVESAVVLWDTENDAFVSCVYEMPKLFYTVKVFGVYFD